MAEPLKNHFGAAVPRHIARMIEASFPRFESRAFLRDVLEGYEPLELMPRGWKIARALREHLPKDYPRAVDILLSSLEAGPRYEPTSAAMAPFLYMPHTMFVMEYGLEHFEVSMRAQHALTQRFTAEFSIRPFLEKHPEATLARLKRWTTDPSTHVRRLVSEGTRPRLPWAPRLRAFQADPRPVLELLELLKDDPELYVRRSVANNLNDIGKDQPELLVKTAKRWMRDATPERRWIVRHALRSAVKRGEKGALEVLGFGARARVSLRGTSITPKQAVIGDSLRVSLEIVNGASKRQRVLADLRVHFVKASGRSSPKVFKLKTMDLAPGESARLGKTIVLRDLTTRKHHPGDHEVEALLNGRALPLGRFSLSRTAKRNTRE
jgi:3-methyladenine DNA glycosylase AlkC